MGDRGPTPVLTSPDGITWTRHTIGDLPGPVIAGIAWNGERFVAVGAVGGPEPRAIAVSSDGIEWTFVTPPQVDGPGALAGVTWTGDKFVAVGGTGNVLTSRDGLAWNAEFTGTHDYFLAVAASPQRCIAVGLSGSIMLDAICGDTIFADGFEPR